MVDVTVAYRRKNKDYFQQKSFQDYAYAKSTQEIPIYVPPHEEKGTLNNLLDYTVNYLFSWVFSEQPLETLFQVYKMELQGDGTYQKQNVPWGYADDLQPTVDGFSIIINSDFTPDLTDVIIKFKFEVL